MTNLRNAAMVAMMVTAATTMAGCGKLFDFRLQIVGEQTSLERQVLGTYSALGEDLLAYSSVRGVSPDGALTLPPPATDSQRAAFAAMRDREYNRDDVDRLLAAGALGESRSGGLVVRDAALLATPGLSADEATVIVGEENDDRAAILGRLIETTGGGEANRAEVEWIFAKLNSDRAPAGAWVQDRAGNWSRK